MAGTSLTIDIDDRAVLDALQGLQRAAEDLTPAFREIGEYLTEATRTRIEHGGPAPDGTPWAPLDKKYQRRKKKNKDKILILDGYLLGSIHPEPSATQVTVGTNREYAAAQQFGRPEINLPARPFLGLSDDDRREVLDILQEHLRRASE